MVEPLERDSRAEQREQVKRTLLARIQAEVPATAVLQQPAQRPVVSTFDVLLNPIIHTQIVEPVRRLRIVSVGRGEVDLLRLLLQERSEYLEIPRQFFRAIIAIEEIHDALHRVPPYPRQVDGSEAEALDQLVQGLMVAVDELAAPLADHTILPGDGIGVHATADAVGRFIDAARETGILQGQSRIESRNSCSDDSDPGHGSSPIESTRR